MVLLPLLAGLSASPVGLLTWPQTGSAAYHPHMSSFLDTPATAALLAGFGSATLGESGGVALPAKLRPIWPGASFAGPAFTVGCPPGDNLAMHAGIAKAPAGVVMVVSVAGDVERGYWGEVMTTAAQAAGVVALVIDGFVRDVDRMRQRNFPVFARGAALRGSTKTGPGTIGGPVAVADTLVFPGDWVVGDVDGLVVIRRNALAQCIEAARTRSDKESQLLHSLESGKTTVELLGLDISSITSL
jgi:4-hydroxy-4-methyl-2-oxoglutarate aldolase